MIMVGKYDSFVDKSAIEIQIAQANELARANELHKLELLIYLAPRHVLAVDQSPEVQKEGIEKNNKQRDEFTKRVKDV